MNVFGLERGPGLNVSGPGDSQDSSDPNDDDILDNSFDEKPRGLVGLQNIGNTCYMNSAIQALSNTPPLTQYFLDCGATIDFLTDNKKPGLSRSYQRLVKDIWNKKTRGYVVPNGILYGIRNVHPMFRGYYQHDTQEFLRCFMDQLHEELKEPVKEDKIQYSNHIRNNYITSQPTQNISSNSTTYKNVDTVKSKYLRNREANVERRSVFIQKSPARSYDNIPSATFNKCHRVHTQSENNESTANELFGHRRSASYCDPRGYFQLPQELKGGTSCSSTRPASPLDYIENESSEKEIDDEDEETYETCDSGASDSASLNEDNNRVVQHNERIKENNKHKSDSDSKVDSTASSQIRYRSVISEIFDGRLLSSVQCLTCDRISTRIETFQDLSLPIPSKDHMAVLHNGGPSTSSTNNLNSNITSNVSRSAACSDAMYSATSIQEGWVWWILNWLRSWFYGPAVSLHDCLSAFFSADELKGDNMYSCEKCNKLRNGVKFSKVLGLPEVLCIHLKRFRHELMSSTKINAKVSFPLNGLDVRPYLHKDCSSTVSTYDLVAVICHAGTAGGGHYTCVAKNQLTDRWFEFDDQYVTGVTPEQVATCEAYVLFYRKTNPHMITLRQKAFELIETSHELNDMKFYVSKQWINRFNTCAEPGPIDNRDFLCPHGGVSPERIGFVEKLTIVVSQFIWEFLYENFGGGPVCNHLHSCITCSLEIEKLQMRQKSEIQHFTVLHQKFSEQEAVSSIYAISMNWFRMWQAFVRNRTQQPPPPIDNTNIIKTSQDNKLIIKPGSDYAQLNEDLWRFFHEIYGGGPEVKLKSVPCVQPDQSSHYNYFIMGSNNLYSQPSSYSNYVDYVKCNPSRQSYLKSSNQLPKESDSDDNMNIHEQSVKSLSNIDVHTAHKQDNNLTAPYVRSTQSLQDFAPNKMPVSTLHHVAVKKDIKNVLFSEDTSEGANDCSAPLFNGSDLTQYNTQVIKYTKEMSSDDSDYQTSKTKSKKISVGKKYRQVSEAVKSSLSVDNIVNNAFHQKLQQENIETSPINNKSDSTINNNHSFKHSRHDVSNNSYDLDVCMNNNDSLKTIRNIMPSNDADNSHLEVPSELSAAGSVSYKSRFDSNPNIHQNVLKYNTGKHKKTSRKMKRQNATNGQKKGINISSSSSQSRDEPIVNGNEKPAK